MFVLLLLQRHPTTEAEMHTLLKRWTNGKHGKMLRETRKCILHKCSVQCKMKWNESGFRPPLCTYRLNWARRTSWWWWDDWDDTVLQTQDSKFEPWRSEAEQATSRSRRLPTILTFTRGWGRNIFCFFQIAETGNRAPPSVQCNAILGGRPDRKYGVL